ncbi:MAG TPA: ABC transporter permease [Candidatus Fimimonas merdipullorum]|uniref:ABC transporter permease n=1 Tax=Candidatus Fimimonas merdipullorum TaxID=2840822 RepID=A0A9D1MW69_9BACT|nr:ABC transporter permease [Candidatus Fimimonas merdipullorum]
MKSKTIKMHFSRKVFAYPYMAFLLVFVVTPLVLILINAFVADGKLTFQNFVDFFADSGSLTVLGNSLIIGLVTTVICLAIGYPVAYILAKYHAGNKVFVLLFILPMWVNFLIRTLSLKSIFLSLDVPLGMGTVVFGMVYNYLPYMILPLHTTLLSIDHGYVEAAEDLGADKLTVLLKTVLPLSVPGIISGVTMTFIPAISTFAISELLSNRQIYLFGDSINTKFTVAQNFGVGSVMSLVMLVLVIVANVLVNVVNKEDSVRSTL